MSHRKNATQQNTKNQLKKKIEGEEKMEKIDPFSVRVLFFSAHKIQQFSGNEQDNCVKREWDRRTQSRCFSLNSAFAVIKCRSNCTIVVFRSFHYFRFSEIFVHSGALRRCAALRLFSLTKHWKTIIIIIIFITKSIVHLSICAQDEMQSTNAGDCEWEWKRETRKLLVVDVFFSSLLVSLFYLTRALHEQRQPCRSSSSAFFAAFRTNVRREAKRVECKRIG